MTAETSETTWIAEVTVLPKPGVNDPEGDAILGGLRQLGHEGVASVRAGRLLRLTIQAPSAEAAHARVARMCDELLANPVIERYEIEVAAVDDPAGRA